MTRLFTTALLLGTALSLNACSGMLDKLDRVGKHPEHSDVQDPTQKADYHPLTWPTPEMAEPGQKYANSLWQPGARAFFRDQRASRIGDILRVNIDVQDKAQVDNQTKAERKDSENVAAPKLFGLGKLLFQPLPGSADPKNLENVTDHTKYEGIGNINRQEKIKTQVAATVVQVMPNGNLAISGTQEVNVNYEMRALSVKGIVRREDINSDNTIDLSQIAEARISYGGKGQLDDIQIPRYGSQVVDAISPF